MQSHPSLVLSVFSPFFPYYIIPLAALMRQSTVLRCVTMHVQINSLRDRMGEYDWLIREKMLLTPTPNAPSPRTFFVISLFFVINKRLAFVLLKPFSKAKDLRESFLYVHKDEK